MPIGMGDAVGVSGSSPWGVVGDAPGVDSFVALGVPWALQVCESVPVSGWHPV